MESEKIRESIPCEALNTEPSEHNHNSDTNDAPPSDCKITNCDIFFLFFSIATHVIDVGIDINLACRYYINDKITMFAWTVVLILFPSLVNTIVSLKMHQQDREKNVIHEEPKERKSFSIKAIKFLSSICIVAFQITLAERYVANLIYALKSRICKRKGDKVGQRHYFLKMLKEEQDVALLRVLECFLEAAPQQILQLSIFVHEYHGEFNVLSFHQLISIGSSFISMAWAMVSYHRSIRLAQCDKLNINFKGTILLFLWHFFITISRIACVCAAAVYSTLCVSLVCIFHWVGMTSWIITESHGIIIFCQDRSRAPHLPLSIKERISSTLFSCVFGFVYLFIYLNPEDNRTYARHLFYYSLCFLENISASVLVTLSTPTKIETLWYHYLISVSCIIPFILGISVMITYYIYFHPTTKHYQCAVLIPSHKVR